MYVVLIPETEELKVFESLVRARQFAREKLGPEADMGLIYEDSGADTRAAVAAVRSGHGKLVECVGRRATGAEVRESDASIAKRYMERLQERIKARKYRQCLRCDKVTRHRAGDWKVIDLEKRHFEPTYVCSECDQVATSA